MAWLDWMTYLKLVGSGHVVDVIPEALFYYRVRDQGMLRTADGEGRAYALQQRLLRRYFAGRALPPAEQAALLEAMPGFRRAVHAVGVREHEIAGLREQIASLQERLACARYRAADRLHRVVCRIPLLHSGLRAVMKLGRGMLRVLGRKAR
jgi:hypothetical protein